MDTTLKRLGAVSYKPGQQPGAPEPLEPEEGGHPAEAVLPDQSRFSAAAHLWRLFEVTTGGF